MTTAFRFKANGTPKAELSSELVTEDQAAIEFVRRYEGKLRFFREASLWYEWNGSVWRENLTGLAFHWARELARDLAAAEPDRVRYVASKTSFAAGVERFARSDPAFAVTSKDWDQDPMLLGTPGGTVDLRTGVLMPGRPEWGITKSTLCAPTDEAECPRWIAFLSEATGGDRELIRFLQQWSGYCLTGDVSEQALIFVHGPGGNGKTVFVNAITSIMGDYSCTAAMDTFTASRGDRHPTELAMLRGARVVTASETEHGRAWAEAKIKQLTGGDAITAHFMRKDDFTFRPTFKLTIIGNHKPRLRNVDDAMQRRVNIIPFVHKPRQPDSRLEEKLRNEWPGILRWMLDGCLDWQKNRLVRPASVTLATGKYFADQDLWAQWLDEECDAEPRNRWKMAASSELFQSWSSYAKAACIDPGSKVEFAEKLESQGFEPDKASKGRRVWRGVSLRSQEHQQ